MKAIVKILGLTTAVAISFFSCDENDGIRAANTTAVPTPTSSTADFLMVNAVADGGSLDFYVNGLKTGASVDLASGQTGYATLPITTPGILANTSLRAKATAGTIGGKLGSNDAIYRATSTGTGNLVAAPNGRYTLIALDSISRPAPLRTFSLNALSVLVADLTYYNRANGQQISKDAFNLLPVGPTGKDNAVSLGTIPAGISDPGGVRFLLLTDAADAAAATTLFTFPANNTTQSKIRFINAVPNAYSLPVNTRISARLKPAAGATITLGTNAEYTMMSVSGVFTPSVGSRATTSAFTLQTTTVGLIDPTDLISYTLELSTDGFATIAYATPNPVTFKVGKVYTIVARGIAGKTGSKGLSVAIAQHN